LILIEPEKQAPERSLPREEVALDDDEEQFDHNVPTDVAFSRQLVSFN